MEIYCNKLAYGKINAGLEATFQLELALILKNVLDEHTLSKTERFSLTLEENTPIHGGRNYVDIAIHYDDINVKKDFLVELKFKKASQAAPDLGTIETYFDLYNLDKLHNDPAVNPGHVAGCFVVFLTNLQTYSTAPRSGTRVQLPMHDGARITAGSVYMPNGAAARKVIGTKYGPSFPGFSFSKDVTFEYNNFTSNGGDDYWYFICEL